MKAPFVTYADTESIIQQVAHPATQDYNTKQISQHIPCSFAYAIVRSDGRVTSRALYRGDDAMDAFFSNVCKKNFRKSEKI